MREQPIAYELSKFAYFKDIRESYLELARIASPEPWQFRRASFGSSMPEVTILANYIRAMFWQRAVAYSNAFYNGNQDDQDRHIYFDQESACLHTGLHTPDGRGIYMYFVPSTGNGPAARPWFFLQYIEGDNRWLRQLKVQPECPPPGVKPGDEPFHPDWPVMQSRNMILRDREVVAALPEAMRDSHALLERITLALSQSMVRASLTPGYAVPQYFKGTLRYSLPLYLTGKATPDLAILLKPIEEREYVMSHLSLPEDVYSNARQMGPVTADWLTCLVTDGVREQAMFA